MNSLSLNKKLYVKKKKRKKKEVFLVFFEKKQIQVIPCNDKDIDKEMEEALLFVGNFPNKNYDFVYVDKNSLFHLVIEDNGNFFEVGCNWNENGKVINIYIDSDGNATIVKENGERRKYSRKELLSMAKKARQRAEVLPGNFVTFLQVNDKETSDFVYRSMQRLHFIKGDCRVIENDDAIEGVDLLRGIDDAVEVRMPQRNLWGFKKSDGTWNVYIQTYNKRRAIFDNTPESIERARGFLITDRAIDFGTVTVNWSKKRYYAIVSEKEFVHLLHVSEQKRHFQKKIFYSKELFQTVETPLKSLMDETGFYIVGDSGKKILLPDNFKKDTMIFSKIEIFSQDPMVEGVEFSM